MDTQIARTEMVDGGATSPTGGRSWVGGVVVLLIVGAFAAWFAVRVRTAVQKRDAIAEERARTSVSASEALKNPAQEVVQTVAGVAERWRAELPIEGTLSPVREADLGFKLPGRLATIAVRLGERVGAGATLATLESAEAAAQVDAAKAQLRAAEAQLSIAEDAARRTTALVGAGTVAQASGVQVSQQQALVAAQVDGARAQLLLAQASLKNHTLTTPFDGVVTRVPSGPGAIVGPGMPLFHVQDSSTLKLAGTVAEADAALVKAGSSVELLQAGVAGAAGAVVKGKVAAILSSVDPTTRRVPLEAQFANVTGSAASSAGSSAGSGARPLLAGSFVRASVRSPFEVEVLRLPGATLRPGSQDEIVVAKDGHLFRRRVAFTTGKSGDLLVRSGLSPSERVVLSPSAEARDGDLATAVDGEAR